MPDLSAIGLDAHMALTALLNKLAPEAIAEVRQLADSAGTREALEAILSEFLPGA